MTDLAALLERVLAAKGTDWELNRDIGLALGGWSYLPTTHEIAARFPEYPWLDNGDREIFADSSGAIHEPDYLASLDACIALCERVLPGASPAIGQNVHHGYWHARLSKVGDEDGPFTVGEANAPTPARALLAAIVKARMAQDE